MGRVIVKGITPIKIVLAVLFFILGLGESLDGIFDVGDYAVPMFFILILNDIFLRYREEKKGLFACPVILAPAPNKFLRWGMNIFFFLMLFMPLFMEVVRLDQGVREGVFKIAAIIWACIFLFISVNRLRKSFAYPKLIICHIALFLLMGSIFLI